MKTLQIIASPKAGGAETFYLRFVQALAANNEVIPLVRKGSWLASQLESCGIEHYTAPFRKRFDFKTRRIIKSLISQHNPQVVQAWMNRAASFIPARINLPTVGRLGGYYKLKNYKNCKYLVGNTKDIHEYLILQKWPQENSEYLPNFAPSPPKNWQQNRTATRQQLNLKDEDFAGLIAGRLHPNKAIDVAISAAAKLPPNAHIIVAGQGAQQAELSAQAAAFNLSDRIHFIGWQDDISKYASAADCWLVPSRHEPLGNVVLDGWMHQLPVVATSSQGPAVLIEDGINGLLSPIDNSEDFATNIQKIMESPDLAQKIAKAGNQKCMAEFSQDVVMKKWQNFYLKITEEASNQCAA